MISVQRQEIRLPATRSTNECQQQLFARPGWRHLVFACGLGLLFTVWLELIYGGADYVTGLRTLRVPVHFQWELAIPFVPAMTVFYLSIMPMFWIGPFILRTRREVIAFTACLALVTLCAGIIFLLVPARLAYPKPDVPARWVWLYHVADVLNMNYNLLPSLHVTFAILCVDIYSRRAGTFGRVFLRSWGLSIALATILTHQHHVLDVVSGFVLALVVSRCFYVRWVQDS